MLTVLLVEESKVDVGFVRSSLAAQPDDAVDLVVAASLSQALAAMRDMSVDLILLNATLPDALGEDAVSTAICHAGRAPVIVLTDQDDPAFSQKIARLGAQDCLVKDAVTNGNFHRRLHLSVERQRLLRALDSQGRELAAARARYQNLVRDSADAMIVTDIDGSLLYANPAAEAFFGRLAHDLLGSRQVVPPQGDAFLGGSTGDDLSRVVVERPSGVRATGLRRISSGNWGGNPAWIVTIRDVTERDAVAQALETAEQMADHANLMKSRFLAGMSHELRTPLNSILGYAEAMKMELFGTLGSARYGEYVDHIFNSGSRLLDLINNLMDLSKAETDAIELEESALDLVLLLRAAISVLAHPAAEHSLSVTLIDQSNGISIHGDSTRLMQAFLSVLSNAIKFTEPGGSISVTVRDQGAQGVVVTIADTGIGIEPRELETIFEPFSRHGEERAHAVPGSDVGLSLTRRLVERHDGRITIDSHPNRGTKVEIAFPVSRVLGADPETPLRISA